MRTGDIVWWRETWHGQTWLSMPVRVIAHTDEHVAVYVAQGTPFAFHDEAWPWRYRHPWAGRCWEGNGVLILHPEGEPYAIWHFWDGPERSFAGWYVNLQAPFAWNDGGFDTLDHELDICIDPDGSWCWKDVEELKQRVREGRFSTNEARKIRADGELVIAKWPFPTGWESWAPDPSWPVPSAPS